MNPKISFLLICIMYASNSNSMSVEQNITTPKLSLSSPLRPRNIDLLEAVQFVEENYKSEPDIDQVISQLINSKVDDDESIQQKNALIINSLMTVFSFEQNKNNNDLGELATPKVHKLYSEKVFPKFLDALCKSTPQDLVLKTAWQILNTMPSLYDTFDAKSVKGALTNRKQIKSYINLIIKVVQTDFAEQDVLLTRLIKNLGTDLDFLDLIDEKISEDEVFKNQINAAAKEHKIEDFEGLFKTDTRLQEISRQINLIHQKIVEFKHEIEIEKLEQRLNKKIMLQKNFDISSSTKNEDDTKQEETEE